MNTIYFIFLGIIIILLIIIAIITKKYISLKRQLRNIYISLIDIYQGNINIRLHSKDNYETRELCFLINNINRNHQQQLIHAQEEEKAYKDLMINLSHDVKTPLSSLVGYLEAIHDGMAVDEEISFVNIALNKAYDLKDFIDLLFQWTKLEANIERYQYEKEDIIELSRRILSDWIDSFDEHGITQDIEIGNESIIVLLDRNSYRRILDNIFKNILIHSSTNRMSFKIENFGKQVHIEIQDYGKGISEKDLSNIFDRLYKCDLSRYSRGNGLGLSITKELVTGNRGTIEIESKVNNWTKFHMFFPKVL